MAAVCISNCGKDAARRAHYMNLYDKKWPESDSELAKTSDGDGGGYGYQNCYFLHPAQRVVDSASCRQLYVRSAYTFSRKESVPERTKRCFGKVKERVAIVTATGKFRSRRSRRARLVTVKRVKDFSCEAMRSIFQRLLFCTATVDVVEHN